MNNNKSTCPYSLKNIDILLEEIRERGNLKQVLLAFRDGGLISDVGTDEFESIQFAAMCASVLESAEGLGQTIGEDNTSRIITELEKQSIIIVKCSKKTFLVVILKADSKVEFITSDLHEYIIKIIATLEV